MLVLTNFVGSQLAERSRFRGEWVLPFSIPFYCHFFPVENGVAIEGSSLGRCFLLDGCFRQDSNYGYSLEEAFSYS